MTDMPSHYEQKTFITHHCIIFDMQDALDGDIMTNCEEHNGKVIVFTEKEWKKWWYD